MGAENAGATVTWIEIAAIVVPVIVTGIVAVLSSRYGAKSAVEAAERQVDASVRIAKQNNEAAEERIKTQRLLHKREEIAETLYGHLQALETLFLGVYTPVEGESVDSVREEHQAFENRLGTTRDYFESKALWLDEESRKVIEKILFDYLSHIGQINMAVLDMPTTEITPGSQAHRDATKPLQDWAMNEYPQMKRTVEKNLKSVLGMDRAERTESRPDSEEKKRSTQSPWWCRIFGR